MDILIADQKAFVLVEQVDEVKAKERAWDKKTSVFGSGLTSMLNRPRQEDVSLLRMQKRFEPLWHAKCHSVQRYLRAAKYDVPLNASVRSVELFGQTVEATPSSKLALEGVEHCVDENKRDRVYDGLTSAVKDWAHYLKFPASEITDLALFAAQPAIVLVPQLKASYIVRELLRDMLKPVQADAIQEETLTVDAVNLYYRPIYAYEFEWKTKDNRKTAVAELDALSGEWKNGGQLSDAKPNVLITRDALFDITVDAAGLIFPGANVALRLVKAGIDYRQRAATNAPLPDERAS